MAEGFRLCITYAIRGRLAYLSHLETVEAMRRIVRRSALPYAVSEGFSPHMKATFGPALPVGASGEDERFDVRLTEYVPADEALARLVEAAPANLVPLHCEYTDLKAPALDVALPVSRWRARFAVAADADETLAVLTQAFDALVAQGGIEVVKRKRKKVMTKTILFSEKLIEPPVFSKDDGHVVMGFATKQDSDGALRPDLFIDEGMKLLPAGVCTPALVSLVRERLCEG